MGRTRKNTVEKNKLRAANIRHVRPIAGTCAVRIVSLKIGQRNVGPKEIDSCLTLASQLRYRIVRECPEKNIVPNITIIAERINLKPILINTDDLRLYPNKFSIRNHFPRNHIW